MRRMMTAAIAAGLMLTGCGGHTAGTAVSPSTSTVAASTLDLVQMYEEIGDPCPPNRPARKVSTIPPEGAADRHWPQESEVRDRLAQTHTPSTDVDAVNAELREIKTALWASWYIIREDGLDLVADPTDQSVETKMGETQTEFNEDLDMHLAALASGNLPTPPNHMDTHSETVLCTG